MRNLRLSIISILLMLFCFSCQISEPEPEPIPPQNHEKEKIAVNQEIIRRENADVELIAKRYNWKLTQTATGLYYQILNPTNGKQPQPKDIVKIKGSIMLPDGKEIYNSNVDGLKEIIINQSGEPIGLHELLTVMHAGEKANAIIPSYLAYGISGDGMKIPAASSLICKVELINVK
ncbi:MAG: FKBP-type peptidyl-prolyl cis-trans isomerase [Bacteroidales bacterium]|nr:FKBP-type peptidyl-prolyl cis-trans isomerase [Bacteroidales bacterium]